MKIAVVIAASVFIFQQANGCDEQKAPKEVSQREEPPIRRFEPVTSHGTSDVALDTKTGQLCRTWDWEYRNKSDVHDLNDLPTCYSIYIADQKTVIVTPSDMKNP